MTPHHEDSDTVDASTPIAGRPASRRSILRATGGTAAGVLGTSLLGSASAGDPTPDHLATDGNQIVDASGSPVQLHGATLIDPLRAQRQWRGKTASEMFELATSRDWPHNLVRVPCQPQDIAATLARGDSTGTSSFIPHEDVWGPIKPGTFTADHLEEYLDRYIDPLVDAARERGVTLMLDYHREYPVFFQRLYEEKEHRGTEFWNDSWERFCLESDEYDWDWDYGMCGHRGVLWHGPDQITEIKSLPHNQKRLNDSDMLDPWFDPWCGAGDGEDLLGDEVRLFWKTVADRYGGDADRHVVFDLFNAPTGPYAGSWGTPDRASSGPHGGDWYAPEYGGNPWPYETPDVTDPDRSRPYWDLFLDRVKPWLDTIGEHAPGRLVTLGSPRWSQYTYWASEKTVTGTNGTESLSGVNAGMTNVAYTAQIHTQEYLRPLSTSVGTPAEHVPVVITEFGWDAGGGSRWLSYIGGTTAVFGDGDSDAIEQWGRPEGVPDPRTLDADEKDRLNHFGMCPEDRSECPIDDHQTEADHYPAPSEYVGFRAFFQEHPVHPIAAYFDHTWNPRFFDDMEIDDGDWELRPRSKTPGVWWQEYLVESTRPDWPEGATDPDGDALFEDLSGDGTLNFPDVNRLFQNTDSNRVQDNAEFYDFDGDGGVDMQDVLALFEMV
ncbi:cellulase family glycosylhydrolase [Halococcoides cellulosivorans]|uniref:Uncharacterized protein n=1 Tax=Halococcoides cellulosivorans TaxID=1679096 RepID=A0A2R4WYT8_9EURY|nr:cellulase family glycosylhydrolase [Halococcoides cellulosivorans]AWB26707.1 hypothetical protein HARCEL1_02750 [Halococcoides cellulosivorans]